MSSIHYAQLDSIPLSSFLNIFRHSLHIFRREIFQKIARYLFLKTEKNVKLRTQHSNLKMSLSLIYSPRFTFLCPPLKSI